MRLLGGGEEEEKKETGKKETVFVLEISGFLLSFP